MAMEPKYTPLKRKVLTLQDQIKVLEVLERSDKGETAKAIAKSMDVG